MHKHSNATGRLQSTTTAQLPQAVPRDAWHSPVSEMSFHNNDNIGIRTGAQEGSYLADEGATTVP